LSMATDPYSDTILVCDLNDPLPVADRAVRLLPVTFPPILEVEGGTQKFHLIVGMFCLSDHVLDEAPPLLVAVALDELSGLFAFLRGEAVFIWAGVCGGGG